MKFALVNPDWTFDGSIYFGCREPHLPLEFGYARELLTTAGHEVLLLDGHLHALGSRDIKRRLDVFRPDFTVITTAPTYLFWRCPPPELRVPMALTDAVRESAGVLVAVGPHGSTTPTAVLKKLRADIVVMGEFEEVLPRLAESPRRQWEGISSICFRDGVWSHIQGSPHASDIESLPVLHWPDESIGRHVHHHHRFDQPPSGPGAEMETSRGCPFRCSFCAKDNFRNQYRRRPLATVLEELDGLLAQGARYIYFIDEIFYPDREMLEAFASRDFRFGIQTRIDLWNEGQLDLLGRAGCVAVEAGIESITEEGRRSLGKPGRVSGETMISLLAHARKSIPFVQANLVCTESDSFAAIEKWRQRIGRQGVWANKPVPLFPYPGSPLYSRIWGPPGELAWEQACGSYLSKFSSFSDIQCERPVALGSLEARLASDA